MKTNIYELPLETVAFISWRIVSLFTCWFHTAFSTHSDRFDIHCESIEMCVYFHVHANLNNGTTKGNANRIWHNFRNSEQQIEWINFRTDSLYLIHVSYYLYTNKQKYFLFRALKKLKKKKITKKSNNIQSDEFCVGNEWSMM